MNIGGAQPSLKVPHLLEIEIPLLPLPQQRSIARVLSVFDDKIELNRRINHTLEEMARALFKSWFVDFDPVTAKAEGRAPFGMNAETASLFPAEFEETEEGSIPKGWKVGTLKQIAEVNSDSIRNDYSHREINYIDISSVESGHLIGMTNMEIQNAPSRARRLVKHGDTIWSCVRPNRKSYLFIQHPAANVVVSTGFAVLSPKIPSTSFVYLWVTTDDFVDYLTANAEGSAYPAVRPESFERASVVIPPDDVLIAFEKIVKPLFELRYQNAVQMQNLAATRDALLPKLMSGELRVKQAEKVIENM
jgi:type I restriction enzyme S subunit